MKLYYVANARLPTEKAHGLQIVSMCHALSKAGCDVTLVIPDRLDSHPDKIASYYDIPCDFNVQVLPCIDTYGIIGSGKPNWLNQVLAWIQSTSFAFQLRKLLKDVVCYTRDDFTAAGLLLFGRPVARELHALFGKTLASRMALRRCDAIITITHGLKQEIVDEYGVREQDVLVAPDAVDKEKFSLDTTKQAARKKLGLPADEHLVLYAGHLYDWKGADTLAEAAKQLPGYEFAFVGGRENDVARFSERYVRENVRLLGYQPHSDIPLYLRAADVLVLPNSAKHEISRKYTSPMKLFEYMASGRPIVASDLPSIREVLDEDTTFFAQPDNPSSFADAIQQAIEQPEEARSKARRAQEKVNNYTWDSRAQRILAFIRKQN